MANQSKDPLNVPPFVSANNIVKRFGGVQALAGVSVNFYPGEVHCLAGENGCGKSTLMKVISGAHPPTSGTVTVDGTEYSALNPGLAYRLGLDIIYQDFSLMPNLSVAENIALVGFLADRRKIIRRKKVNAIAEEAVAALGVPLDLKAQVGDLTVAERQLCAVARALAHSAKFIAMDEPTTALTWREVDALFESVAKLRTNGVALAFISHKMQEVFSISDRVSIMRNGMIVDSGKPSDFSHASLAEKMTGRAQHSVEVADSIEKDAPPALEVEKLGHYPLFDNISFSVRQGEIVGVSGLLGSGRTEIAEAISGVNPPATGTIKVEGKPVKVTSMETAMAAGIGYVPEDRLTQGLFLDQPIGDNLISAHTEKVMKRGLVNNAKSEELQREAVRDLRIKIDKLQDRVRSLSGGNAQRVLLAKWLVGEPKVLILNGPTVGVDVGSKFDILSVLRAQSLCGLGVLIISDDVPELVSTCHRILVVRSGKIISELTGDELNESNILKAIAQ